MFNNEIIVSDGINAHRVEKGSDYKDILRTIEKANLCVVDVDVLIAAAVEFPIEKKDSILVRKFKELYQHEAYIIQDERIDNNLFQVIGIKEIKVREIYSLISPDRVVSFIPYGIALRNTLLSQRIDLNRTVVFVDEFKGERLLTVFDGLKFSRTRIIANNEGDILPEIKRSQIDFLKKTEEFLSKKSADFVIVVNDQDLAQEISKNEENLQIECLNVKYPALEGLKAAGTSVNYRLPEESFKKRREIELKKRVRASSISLCVVAVGVLFFLFNKVELGIVKDQCELARQTYEQLDGKLNTLDKETYREDLRLHKSLNYGISYLSMLEIIPASYTVNSFKFCKTNKWNIEMILFPNEDGVFDPIPRIKILRDAEIKDIFVNNQPGKHLKVAL